jgi:hypothetical protein
VFFQIVKTLLYAVFVPVYSKCFNRVFDIVRKQGKEPSVFFAVYPDCFIVEPDFPASRWCFPDNEKVPISFLTMSL